MTDVHRLSVGIIGTLTSWILETVGPVAPTVASLATVAFLSTCIAEKFGLLDRFRSK